MTILLNYHIGRIVLGSMCVGVLVWLLVCCKWSHITCMFSDHTLISGKAKMFLPCCLADECIIFNIVPTFL